jgi:pyroglutamyl-peptidase
MEMSRQVLMTGFDPFDNEPINAAWEVVQRFQGYVQSGFSVAVRQLPTVFETSLQVLETAISDVKPDVVICVGQAGGRSAVSIERIGVNLDDARIPDNAGDTPSERPIHVDGPAAYWSTLPVRHMVNGVRALGIPAEESYTAGTYVCNHTLYGLMHMLAQPRFAGVVGGFIHIPFLPSQAIRHKNAPSMHADDIEKALRQVIEIACN